MNDEGKKTVETMKTVYKFIEFVPMRDEYNRDGWVCQNRKHGDELGLVIPDTQW